MASDRITIRLPEDVRDQLRALTKSTGKSESEIVREAISKLHDAQGEGPSALELALKTGLVGCIKDAPKDLSVNPKYMDGFGRD